MTLVPLIGSGGLKEWLKIDEQDTSRDAIITAMQASVEELVEAFCECKFSPTVVTDEVHDGVRSDTLVPEHYPVISVQEIRFATKPDGSGGDVVDPETYHVRPDSVIFQRRFMPKGRVFIGIDYTHGHSSVPAKVDMAVKLSVEAFLRRYEKKTIGGSGASSLTKEGESVVRKMGSGSFSVKFDTKTGLPVEAIALLESERSLEFPGGNTAARNY